MNQSEKTSVPTSFVSAYDLYRAPSKPRRFLVEGLIPSGTISMLVGPSDTGKSIFARQLAVSVALRKKSFIGMPLNIQHGKTIYVSTEDGSSDWQEKLHKLSLEKDDEGLLKNLLLDFNDGYSTVRKIEEALKNTPVDLIVVDVLGDTIGSVDLNSTTVVRSYFLPFKQLAEKYGCAVVFVHHVNKKAENNGPSKLNVLGSQALEASCRAVFELRRGQNDTRVLTVTKGNYLSDKVKAQSITLDLNTTTLEFNRTGTLSTRALSPQAVATAAVQEKIMELFKEGLSVRNIEDTLKANGVKIGKSTVSKVIRELKSGKDDVHCPAA